MRSFIVCLLAACAAHATGHGPVYGLSTPTLGRGAFSLDVGAMAQIHDGGETTVMLRPMLGYGLTEDLELTVSAPLPLHTYSTDRPARTMGLMTGTADAEALLSWRFQRSDVAVGARAETTAFFGVDLPTKAKIAGTDAAPGFVAGAVTGYVSRSVYLWAGALYRRYLTDAGADRPGDQIFVSAVAGFRPDVFRRELPHPDFRVFVENVWEITAGDRLGGVRAPGTLQGFVGPTVLGLFGAWGVSGGPLFRVVENGEQRGDAVRLVVNTTIWF